tara:strand:- start:1155 stop:4316 length:3162 start_codon:yes stop_codon:yes gene_type:complete
MITSLKFDSDTLSHTTNVVPLVHIEKTIGTDVNRLGFSTQQLDFTDIDDTPLFYSPLLLDMPSLSESIDFESKKYKISSVTLKLSNIEYLGERLSDKYNILLNSIVTVWYKTQNANTLEECLKVYTGKVTRITHDYDVINLILEDNSQSKLHKSIPIEKLSQDDGVLEKYRNKPIPMVYGHVERSPLVFTDNYKTLKADKLDIQFYNEPNKFELKDEPLFMDVDYKINVLKTRNDGEVQYEIEDNSIKFKVLEMPTNLSEQEQLQEEQYLECNDSTKSYTVSLSNILQQNTDGEIGNYDLNDTLSNISNDSYNINEIDWVGFRTQNEGSYDTNNSYSLKNVIVLLYDSNDGTLAIDFRVASRLNWTDEDFGSSNTNFEDLLLKLGFNFTPKHDYKEINGSPALLKGFCINGINLSEIAPYNYQFNPSWGYVIQTNSDDFGGYSGDEISGVSNNGYDGYDDLHELQTESVGGTGEGVTFNKINSLFNFETDAWSNNSNDSWDGGNNPNAAINIKANSFLDDNDKRLSELTLTGNLSEIDLLRTVYATNVLDNDFYGNIIGRSHENWLVYRDFIADFSYTDINNQEWIDKLPLDENGELIYGKHVEHNLKLISLNSMFQGLCYIVPDFIEIKRGSSATDYVNIRFSGKVYEWIVDWNDDLSLLTEEPNLDDIYFVWFIFNDSANTFSPTTMENINYGIIGAAEKDKPSDIMLDILENECNYTDEVSENEIIDVRESHDKWSFAFTQHKSIDSKKLIEEFSASTKSLPRFRGVDGKFVWNTVKDEYTEEDVDLTIKSEDIIRYSYDKTKLEDVKTKVRVKYWNDYADDELKRETSYMSVDDLTYEEGGYNYDYYGIDENDEDSVLEFESKYIRDEYTAEQLRNFLLCFNMNQHNIIKATLPLIYANLEVGDVVAFDNEIQGLKLYGETYTTNIGLNDDGFEVDLNQTYRNGQLIYPYFMIYKTKKNIDKIDIEIIQLHKNDPNYFVEPSVRNNIILLPNGDVNDDGNIDVLDVVAVVSHILGASQLTPEQGYKADLNQDNSIDILDIVQLMEIILG